MFEMNITEFYDLNPSVGSDCTGMNLGTYYCVSTDPGGEALWTTLPDNYTITATVTSSLPADTDTGTATGTATATETTGDGVTTPSPVQTGMVSDCDLFHEVISNDTCYDLAQTNSITLDEFYAWNPAVGTDCLYLELNVYVCVGVLASSSTVTPTTTSSSTLTATTTTSTGGIVTPTPTQDGMVSNCNKFYDVQSGDGCWAIANEYDITLDDFYAWNPAVDECADLYPNYYVCVGTSD
jgi:LysM repeat protein